MKALIVYSGGMDSTVLLQEFKEQIVLAVTFDYGSKHNDREYIHAKMNTARLGIEHLLIPLSFMGQYFESNLLQKGGKIPEGHYEDVSMKQTVVPYRNGIMLSIATGLAESRALDTVLIANHAGDHCIPGNELIVTKEGKKKIEDLKLNDYVLSATDAGIISFKKVLHKVDNGYREDILKIGTTGGRFLRCTSNHKCFVIERSNFNQHTGWEKSLKQKEAKDLKLGDWLLTPAADRPFLEEFVGVSKVDLLYFCDLHNKLLKYDENKIWFKAQNKVNRYVSVDSFTRLLAWFITEGNRGAGAAVKNANNYKACIAQSKQLNPDNYTEIESLLKDWGFSLYKYADGFQFSGPTTKVFDLCGKYSFSKKIPDLSFIDRPLLFYTMLKGDGHENGENQKVYTTSSEILKEQMVWLATMLGFSAGVSRGAAGQYQINMRRNFEKLQNKFGEMHMVQIKSLAAGVGDRVWDITVEENHKFFAGEGSGLLVSNSIYLDCRREFIAAQLLAMHLGTYKQVQLVAPYTDITKRQIALKGRDLSVDFSLTYSCYKGQERQCGFCGTCNERKEALEGFDPTVYEN